MPPKKTKKKKVQVVSLFDDDLFYAAAAGIKPFLAEQTNVALTEALVQQTKTSEKEVKKAFLKGREKEAIDSHDGSYWYVDLTVNEEEKPPEPAPKKESKWGDTPVTPIKKMKTRSRGPATPPKTPTKPVLKYAPNPSHPYPDLRTLETQISRMLGGMPQHGVELMETIKRIPVGEELETDWGPVTEQRKFHAKIERKSRK
jgi:hypothetical protein